eukprot:g8759.t1 g8759   contig34:38337-39239(-)
MKAKWWGVLVWICIGLYFGTLFSNISDINKSIGDEGDEVTPKADYEKKGRGGETRNVKYKYERERQGVRLSDTTTFSSAGCACKQMDIFQILPSKGKLIFAHVPKTAGTSIEHILSIGGSCHATAFELRECNPELFDSALTFTIIRHPLERMVSMYGYAKKGGNGSKSDKEKFAWLMNSDATFDDFIGGIDTNDYFYAPMSKYIGTASKLGVKEILCFDEIGKDWDRIMESIPPDIKPNAHPSAVHSRKGERQQFINTIVEMKATTRERTNSVYREDYLLWDRFCGGREGQLATQKIEAR